MLTASKAPSHGQHEAVAYAPSTAQRSVLSVRLRIAATIAFHSTCAISVTLISKSALNGIEAPISLLCLQTLVQVLFMTMLGYSTGLIQLERPASVWNAVIPLMLARLTGVLLKTFCLLHVDASLYQLARGLLLPFTLLLSRYLITPRPHVSGISLIGCVVVMAGFAFGMFTDVAAMLTSMTGFWLGIISSFTTSLEVVIVKQFLTKSEEGMWQTIWMVNCMSFVCYLPLLLSSGEIGLIWELHKAVVSSEDAIGQATHPLQDFFLTALAGGLANFLLTIAAFTQVVVTSPTTHMIVTAARGVLQSGLAVFFLSELPTGGRAFGMLCILGGSGIYAWGQNKVLERQLETTRSDVSYEAVGNAPVENYDAEKRV